MNKLSRVRIRSLKRQESRRNGRGASYLHLQYAHHHVGSASQLGARYRTGLFINYVIQIGGGLSQNMTQNDRGVGGGLEKDDR